MKILVALYMKFICPAVAQPPYSTWDKVIVLGASTTYALKLKSSSKYLLKKWLTPTLTWGFVLEKRLSFKKWAF